jgi:hypothetical protein
MDNDVAQPMSRKPTLTLRLGNLKKAKTQQEGANVGPGEPSFQPNNRPTSMLESPTKAAMKLLDKSKMSLSEFINLISESDLNASRLSKKYTDNAKLCSVIDEVQVVF